MTHIERYKHWLHICSRYFRLTRHAITGRCMKQTHLIARYTFYVLCIRDGISLYELSIALGRERTTIRSAFQNRSRILAESSTKFANEILQNIKTKSK